jgi:hypothetical protein
MKFLLMIHGDEAGWDELPPDEQQARRERYRAVSESAAVLRASELGPTSSATTVRVSDGTTIVTDGPYAETREALGGIFLVETDSIDVAIELAKQLPPSSGIEIRPVYGGES